MDEIALVINTVSKNSDIWKMFFDQLNKHFPQSIKKYVFVDRGTTGLPEDVEVIYYDPDVKYQEQFAACIPQVTEEYCIYVSEDYVLYENVRMDLVEKFKKILEDNAPLSFVRFMKGGVVDFGLPLFKNYENIFELSNRVPYFYTNQAALWRTRDLEKIHVHGPNLHIANKDWENSFEYQATATCQELNIKGVYSYYGEPKRGLYHYDSIVFPHISTALVKGKWNIAEYPEELHPLLIQYMIDPAERGMV